jgi:hypothetical protein
MNKKQSLYLEIIKLLLPPSRNAQTWSAWKRLIYGNFYIELELIHNIPPLMETREFTQYDIFWLNTQAKNYIYHCSKEQRTHSGSVIGLIKELVNICPDNFAEDICFELKSPL